MSQFLGKNTEKMVADAKASKQGKKTKIFYKGAAKIERKVRTSNGSSKIIEQISFATGIKEGILPDKQITVS